ncbi:MAG: hypothetical protein WCH11_01440, partial [Bdellovibrio sp.]
GCLPDIEKKTSLIQAALEEYEKARGSYLDVHAWQFTPESFKSIIQMTRALGLSKFSCIRSYPTPKGRLEFVAVLKKIEA